MDNKVNYTVVGLFVVILCVALFAIVVWLSDWGKSQSWDHYVVYTKESVSGLLPQAQVNFNGVKVGQVQTIALNKNDPQQVRILLEVKKGTPINQSTVATLKSQGITGVTYVGLSATQATAPPIPVRPGHKYPAIASKPSLLATLSDTLQDSAKHITGLTENLNKVVDEKNQQAIALSLHNIKKITQMIVDNEQQFNQIMTRMNALSGNLAKASEQFPKTMQRVNETLQKLDTMSVTITATGKTMNHTLGDSRVLIENFQQQLMPETVNMLARMNSIASHVKLFTQQLQHNPSIIVRGKTPAALGPGETP